jgi:hypothetical protein
MTIDLVVQGGTAFLGVNSEYVATLDVSQIAGPRNVAGATAFFADTYVEGGIVLYEQFEVWSLDSAPLVDVAVNPPAGAAGSYTSPTFGYSLNWNDTWTEIERGSYEGTDYLVLTNGAVIVDVYSVDMDVEATACNEDLFDVYSNSADYSNVYYLLDSSGNPLIEPGTDVATAWIAFTYTDEEGIATEYYEFDVCMRMPGGSTMVQLEFEALPEDIEANLPAIEELAMGLSFDQVPLDILDAKGGGGLAEGVDEGSSSGQATGRGGSTSGQSSDDDD